MLKECVQTIVEVLTDKDLEGIGLSRLLEIRYHLDTLIQMEKHDLKKQSGGIDEQD